MSAEPSGPAPASQADLASVLAALKSPSPGMSPLLLAVLAVQTLIISAVLALLVYQHLHPVAGSVAPSVVDPLATVRSTATAYRKDEAAAFRRVKATISRTGDLEKDKATLARAIHDQRLDKAKALADALTAASDWPAALEAAAEAFEKAGGK